MTTSEHTTGRSSPRRMLLVEPSKLVPLVRGLKVWELAQLAETSVEAVVASIVQAAGLPAFQGMRETKPRSKRGLRARPGQIVATGESEPEPALDELVGRATRREIRAIVDRWVLRRVLEQNDWIVSHAAAQLEISRRTLRYRWAEVRDLPVESLDAGLGGRSGESPNVTAAPSLAELLARGASRREIHRTIDRWLVNRILEERDGNVTRAATSLDTSRRTLRGMRGDSRHITR